MIDCIIAVHGSFGGCMCSVSKCGCRVCWEKKQWDRIALTPEEELFQPKQALRCDKDFEPPLGRVVLEETWIIVKGKRLEDIMMKLGWEKLR